MLDRRAVARALAISADADSVASGARGRRIHFVDLLRLVASFQMIVGHSIDALLAEELRSGAVYDGWTWVRGLTSVSFMVAAGLSFHLSTLARFDAHVGDRAKVIARFRRGGFLMLVGYLLHFPAGLFFGDADAALREFLIADVLQCIGLCIVLLEAITVLSRGPRQVVLLSAFLAAVCFVAAPLTDAIEPAGPLRFALNYLTHRGGSLFPLTPWAGYVFAGVVIGAVALPHGTRTDARLPLPRLLACAALVCGLAVLARLGDAPAGVHHNALPGFNLVKLAVVLAFVALLAFAERPIVRLPRRLSILAGETLTLYAFHLVVLYAGGVGLYRVIGHALSLPAAIAVALSLLAVTCAVALGWHRYKTRRS